MKILLYGLNHAPEMVGIGRYSGELAQWRDMTCVRLCGIAPFMLTDRGPTSGTPPITTAEIGGR